MRETSGNQSRRFLYVSMKTGKNIVPIVSKEEGCMKFVIRVYIGEVFIGDAYAKTITEAKQKASRMCNNYCSPIAVFEIRGGEFDGLKYHRFNKVTPWNRIYRGKWQ